MAGPRYAEGTGVSPDRSRLELEKLLRRFGADQFGYAWSGDSQEMVMFRMAGRQVRIALPMPPADSPEFTLTAAGRRRSVQASEDAYAQEVRRRWRSLVLVVKAKMTTVNDGISTIEREFLADVVLPDGSTFGEWSRPQFAAIDEHGRMPSILPGGGGR